MSLILENAAIDYALFPLLINGSEKVYVFLVFPLGNVVMYVGRWKDATGLWLFVLLKSKHIVQYHNSGNEGTHDGWRLCGAGI